MNWVIQPNISIYMHLNFQGKISPRPHKIIANIFLIVFTFLTSRHHGILSAFFRFPSRSAKYGLEGLVLPRSTNSVHISVCSDTS